ncbi:flavin reductase family protein [Paenibacillus nanensis]|uniref:Flavin reductase family protein n=1 Tax=Paenibacillus nanensis TaxID=393251 RepID=A0A3A1URR2_9BACL|nr:flavin reductase family protein [Paenibacillus nanensis]RIX49403.1 flavin reductase family protein [Paenibacillus nanensis]
MPEITHQEIKPKILYYGTPVILLSTRNEDGSTNISPLSSSWALGSCIVLGLGIGGKAIENLKSHPECVVNVPTPELWTHVEKLAPLTGKNPVPDNKLQNSFRYEKDKFAAADLTAQASVQVKPDRILECPLQIECAVRNIRIPEHDPHFAIVEAEALKVHAHPGIILDEDRINPEAWSPLIYNFRHYFGLGKELGKTFRA